MEADPAGPVRLDFAHSVCYGSHMDSATRTQLLDRARGLLPRYGGFVEGAMNQAYVLLEVPMDAGEYRELCEALKEEESAKELRGV